jgi:hypothetical protein
MRARTIGYFSGIIFTIAFLSGMHHLPSAEAEGNRQAVPAAAQALPGGPGAGSCPCDGSDPVGCTACLCVRACTPTTCGRLTIQGKQCPNRCPLQCPAGQGCTTNHVCAPPSFQEPKTRVGQAMASVGAYTYEVAVDLDGGVLYTKWKLGSAPSAWWTLGNIDVRTDAAPAITIVDNYLFVSIVGRGGNKMYLNQAGVNLTGYEAWVGWK